MPFGMSPYTVPRLLPRPNVSLRMPREAVSAMFSRRDLPIDLSSWKMSHMLPWREVSPRMSNNPLSRLLSWRSLS